MTLLAMPTLSCNLRCLYCYNRLRPSRIELTKIDAKTFAEKAIALAKMTNHGEVVLHGGEPLLWDFKSLATFIDTVTRAGLRVSIQTNGLLVTPRHIELFKLYGVSVGVSIDGFPDTGYTRGIWTPDGKPLEVNAKIVETVMRNIEAMVRNGIGVGVIIVLTKHNFGDDDKIRRLAEFIKWLKKIGIIHGRLNPAFGLGRAEPYELSWGELLYGYETLWRLIRDLRVGYSPYADISNALLGNFRDVVCWFHGCGFFDSLVYTLEPDGSIAPCDRVIWLGRTPLRLADDALIRSKLRVYALLQTELRNSKNGHIHRGGCPAESPDGDWRRASRFWRTWDELIDFMAEEILKVNPNLRLTNRYPDKIDFVRKADAGCSWNIWRGEFVCPS